jgi:hypothetical protein
MKELLCPVCCSAGTPTPVTAVVVCECGAVWSEWPLGRNPDLDWLDARIKHLNERIRESEERAA